MDAEAQQAARDLMAKMRALMESRTDQNHFGLEYHFLKMSHDLAALTLEPIHPWEVMLPALHA